MTTTDIIPLLRLFARLARIFGQPTEAELKAARIRKNRSDGAKRGAATRARNKAAKRYDELEARSQSNQLTEIGK